MRDNRKVRGLARRPLLRLQTSNAQPTTLTRERAAVSTRNTLPPKVISKAPHSTILSHSPGVKSPSGPTINATFSAPPPHRAKPLRTAVPRGAKTLKFSHEVLHPKRAGNPRGEPLAKAREPNLERTVCMPPMRHAPISCAFAAPPPHPRERCNGPKPRERSAKPRALLLFPQSTRRVFRCRDACLIGHWHTALKSKTDRHALIYRAATVLKHESIFFHLSVTRPASPAVFPSLPESQTGPSPADAESRERSYEKSMSERINFQQGLSTRFATTAPSSLRSC